MMKEQVFAQAALLAGELEEKQAELLKVLCAVSASALEARLKDGVTVEDCREEFILAASLYALADLSTVEEIAIQEFQAGDLKVKQGSGSGETAARCYQRQAEAVMKPYLKDTFAFLGV